ncbi:MAG: alpha/beta fold hydrolase [Phycisphaerales bacterium]|nr:alpha/beta fold hydrolase [Phycisphaerales bacterium]
MIERFAQLPSTLRNASKSESLAGVPTLLAHPDWQDPAPFVFWMHGRTVHKELDPGRYLRWLRTGIATCAIDLPGHGERYEVDYHHPRRTLDLLRQALGEIDEVIDALPDVFDRSRMAIGGMSAGGMVTLRRLCDPHDFVCATVEATTGNLQDLYHPDHERNARWPVDHPPDAIAPPDPRRHLEGFRPIPLLALHTVTDEVVPWPVQKVFLDDLRQIDPHVEVHTFESTGAPDEHAGFGRFANDAKNLQVEFLERHLR